MQPDQTTIASRLLLHAFGIALSCVLGSRVRGASEKPKASETARPSQKRSPRQNKPLMS